MIAHARQTGKVGAAGSCIEKSILCADDLHPPKGVVSQSASLIHAQWPARAFLRRFVLVGRHPRHTFFYNSLRSLQSAPMEKAGVFFLRRLVRSRALSFRRPLGVNKTDVCAVFFYCSIRCGGCDFQS